MSFKIDPSEVLSHLNYLGYKNITAPQLQAFIKDLKKLIKYDRRSNETNEIRVNILRNLNTNVEERTDFTSEVNEIKTSSSENSTETEEKNSEKITSTRRPYTEPSQFPLCKEKKKYSDPLESTSNSTALCPVHFIKEIGYSITSRPKSAGTECLCPIDAYSRVSPKKNDTQKQKKLPCSATDSKRGTSATDKHPCSRENKVHFSRPNSAIKNSRKVCISSNYTHDFTHPCYCPGSKPRSSVIKCKVDNKPPFPKCDPVNLYKYYQRQWEINRIPGENMPREQRFRWCFREKISCGPPDKK